MEQRRDASKAATVAERAARERAAYKQQESLLDYEHARDRALKRLCADMALNHLVEGFSDHLRKSHRFVLDFVGKERAKRGEPFELTDHLDHPLIKLLFQIFLAERYLADNLRSFEAWSAGKRL